MVIIQLMDLKPGERISLKDGSTAEVTDNPMDGVWVKVRYLESAHSPGSVGEEELCHCEEVTGVL
jgi:hypothetical protein